MNSFQELFMRREERKLEKTFSFVNFDVGRKYVCCCGVWRGGLAKFDVFENLVW